MTKAEETRLRNLLSKKDAICLGHNEMIQMKRLQQKKAEEAVSLAALSKSRNSARGKSVSTLGLQ